MGRRPSADIPMLDFRFLENKEALATFDSNEIFTPESFKPLLDRLSLFISDRAFDSSVRAILLQHCTSFTPQEMKKIIEEIQRAPRNSSPSDLLTLLNRSFQNHTAARAMRFNHIIEAKSLEQLLPQLIFPIQTSAQENVLFRFAPLHHTEDYDLKKIATCMEKITALVCLCNELQQERKSSSNYFEQLMIVSRILQNALYEIQYVYAAIATNTHYLGQTERENHRGFQKSITELEKTYDPMIALEQSKDQKARTRAFVDKTISVEEKLQARLFFEASPAIFASRDIFNILSDQELSLDNDDGLAELIPMLRQIAIVLSEKKNSYCLHELHNQWARCQNPKVIWERLLLLEEKMKEKGYRDTLATIGGLKLLLLEARHNRMYEPEDDESQQRTAETRKYLKTGQQLYWELLSHQTTSIQERKYCKELMECIPEITSAVILQTPLDGERFIHFTGLLKKLHHYPALQQKVGGLCLTFVGLCIVLGGALLLGLAATSVIALPAVLAGAGGLLLGLDIAAMSFGGATAALGGLLFSSKPASPPADSLPNLVESTASSFNKLVVQ